MIFELSRDEVNAIIRKAMNVEVKDHIENMVENLIDDDEILNTIKEVLIEFVKSDAGKELLKQSFIDNYIKDSTWLDYDIISDTIDTEISNLIKKIFKNMKFDLNLDNKNIKEM